MAQGFLGSDGNIIVNTTLSVLWNQLIMTLISFLPYFLVTEIIHLAKGLFCSGEEHKVYQHLSFLMDFVTLVAANVAVLAMGDALPRLLLRIVSSIQLSNGLGMLLFMGILLFVYLYHVIYNMFSSDLFTVMTGAVIGAVVLGVDLSGGTRIVLFLVCVAVSYGVGQLRALLVKVLAGGEEGDKADTVTVLCSLVGIVAMAFLFYWGLRLFGF